MIVEFMNFIKENLKLLACPVCKKPFNVEILKTYGDEIISANLKCSSCYENFKIIDGIPHLIPQKFSKDKKYRIWEEKQKYGLEDYENPDKNYQKFIKIISKMFGTFCQHRGNVLDIGCGIGPHMDYFNKELYKDVNFIGIDPLIGSLKRDYFFIQGAGEYLPFLNESMDKVVISTTLDHVIEPLIILKEAERVLKKGGEINIWIGIFDSVYQRKINFIRRAIYFIQKGNFRRLISGLKRNISEKNLSGQGDKYHFNRFAKEQITLLISALNMKINRKLFFSDEGDNYLFMKAEKI